MSHNHGRRILIDGREARDLTRGEVYDALARLIRRMPLTAGDLGYELLSRKEAKKRAVHVSGNTDNGGSGIFCETEGRRAQG